MACLVSAAIPTVELTLSQGYSFVHQLIVPKTQHAEGILVGFAGPLSVGRKHTVRLPVWLVALDSGQQTRVVCHSSVKVAVGDRIALLTDDHRISFTTTDCAAALEHTRFYVLASILLAVGFSIATACFTTKWIQQRLLLTTL